MGTLGLCIGPDDDDGFTFMATSWLDYKITLVLGSISIILKVREILMLLYLPLLLSGLYLMMLITFNLFFFLFGSNSRALAG